jgi:hypothetical protein
MATSNPPAISTILTDVIQTRFQFLSGVFCQAPSDPLTSGRSYGTKRITYYGQ